jgi:hypothetical protein
VFCGWAVKVNKGRIEVSVISAMSVVDWLMESRFSVKVSAVWRNVSFTAPDGFINYAWVSAIGLCWWSKAVMGSIKTI